MVIHDFDFPRLTFTPPKTNPPLIINADAMLNTSVTLQGFRPITGRHLKVIDFLRRVDGKTFSSCAALYLVGNTPNRVAREKRSGTFVSGLFLITAMKRTE